MSFLGLSLGIAGYAQRPRWLDLSPVPATWTYLCMPFLTLSLKGLEDLTDEVVLRRMPFIYPTHAPPK